MPNFLRKAPDDSDSDKTWREIAAVHGAVSFDEASVFRPLIRPKAQNGFVYRGGDDDLTMEEAMKKGIAPKGMKPAWSPEARKKYEACVEPEIAEYKKAVDKINTNALKTYDNDVYDYFGTTFGVGTLPGIFSAAKSDVPIGFNVRTETPPKRVLGNKNRAMFYATFVAATGFYLRKRWIASREEADEFTEATASFFNKVRICREKNPYDMWISMTPSEMQISEFLETLTHPLSKRVFPFQSIFDK